MLWLHYPHLPDGKYDSKYDSFLQCSNEPMFQCSNEPHGAVNSGNFLIKKIYSSCFSISWENHKGIYLKVEKSWKTVLITPILTLRKLLMSSFKKISFLVFEVDCTYFKIYVCNFFTYIPSPIQGFDGKQIMSILNINKL